jgi:hypothetical protein
MLADTELEVRSHACWMPHRNSWPKWVCYKHCYPCPAAPVDMFLSARHTTGPTENVVINHAVSSLQHQATALHTYSAATLSSLHVEQGPHIGAALSGTSYVRCYVASLVWHTSAYLTAEQVAGLVLHVTVVHAKRFASCTNASLAAGHGLLTVASEAVDCPAPAAHYSAHVDAVVAATMDSACEPTCFAWSAATETMGWSATSGTAVSAIFCVSRTRTNAVSQRPRLLPTHHSPGRTGYATSPQPASSLTTCARGEAPVVVTSVPTHFGDTLSLLRVSIRDVCRAARYGGHAIARPPGKATVPFVSEHGTWLPADHDIHRASPR